MIRYINLEGQIHNSNNKKQSFAFFDTITDKFCEFSGNQYWDSLDEFKEDYTGNDIDRFLNLIPKQYSWKDVKVCIEGKQIYTIPHPIEIKHSIKING